MRSAVLIGTEWAKNGIIIFNQKSSLQKALLKKIDFETLNALEGSTPSTSSQLFSRLDW
jgi:hypothetical protein